jgi:hypothetical protein
MELCSVISYNGYDFSATAYQEVSGDWRPYIALVRLKAGGDLLKPPHVINIPGSAKRKVEARVMAREFAEKIIDSGEVKRAHSQAETEFF